MFTTGLKLVPSRRLPLNWIVFSVCWPQVVAETRGTAWIVVVVLPNGRALLYVVQGNGAAVAAASASTANFFSVWHSLCNALRSGRSSCCCCSSFTRCSRPSRATTKTSQQLRDFFPPSRKRPATEAYARGPNLGSTAGRGARRHRRRSLAQTHARSLTLA